MECTWERIRLYLLVFCCCGCGLCRRKWEEKCGHRSYNRHQDESEEASEESVAAEEPAVPDTEGQKDKEEDISSKTSDAYYSWRRHHPRTPAAEEKARQILLAKAITYNHQRILDARRKADAKRRAEGDYEVILFSGHEHKPTDDPNVFYPGTDPENDPEN